LAMLGNVEDALNAVARGLWLRTDDGQPFASQRIEQGGFAGVGPAEDAHESRTKGHVECGANTLVRVSAGRFSTRAGVPAPDDYISFICRGSTALMRTRS